MRQPEHGPGCSVAKPSRPHSFTALVNHTAQVPPARQPVGFDPLTYGAHSMLGGRGRLFGNGSGPHSFTALVNHTAQVPPARQPVGFDPLGPTATTLAADIYAALPLELRMAALCLSSPENLARAA
jgi:hypothetical protein